MALTDPGFPDDYCRQIEAHLCRKNDGHLVRIVGPAFEQVSAWATRGIPLNVALRGVDRYFERYYAKGPRRRPVRIEFCEADVLDVFDEWRRAVGVPVRDPDQPGDAGETPAGRHRSLPAHLERVIARLTTLRGREGGRLDETLDAIVRELDVARSGAKVVRGAARETLMARLRALDGVLLDAVRGLSDPETLKGLDVQAEAELEPFRARMPDEAYRQARRACVDRLVRERADLPVIAVD